MFSSIKSLHAVLAVYLLTFRALISTASMPPADLVHSLGPMYDLKIDDRDVDPRACQVLNR
ncbi:hypothetical protein K435DRAFT_881244 [Dendrothele bispora CBS 962.96]|uniref:Uncharacterized protein n=1 Tax=Dendrothele bispora (strain CBS 962.96) TaxID=1314807 RepID=A0A4S8KII8_DENBC|nr:hypothetical protein K435DRAFT_881244 [Dendrothele bispora CBS 962.96]